MFILQYKVSTTAIDLVVVFALFVFMLVLLCFCVATVFWWIKIYTEYAEQGLCNGQVSVRPSVCPVDRQQQQSRMNLLADWPKYSIRFLANIVEVFASEYQKFTDYLLI